MSKAERPKKMKETRQQRRQRERQTRKKNESLHRAGLAGKIKPTTVSALAAQMGFSEKETHSAIANLNEKGFFDTKISKDGMISGYIYYNPEINPHTKETH